MADNDTHNIIHKQLIMNMFTLYTIYKCAKMVEGMVTVTPRDEDKLRAIGFSMLSHAFSSPSPRADPSG